VAEYDVNPAAIEKARELIQGRQYVLDSDWGEAQPRAEAQNAYLERHSWQDYAAWHLGLTEGATDETKARYAFVYGDFRRLHRAGLIACVYRAAEWRHKQVELAAHDLLQQLDRAAGIAWARARWLHPICCPITGAVPARHVSAHADERASRQRLSETSEPGAVQG